MHGGLGNERRSGVAVATITVTATGISCPPRFMLLILLRSRTQSLTPPPPHAHTHAPNPLPPRQLPRYLVRGEQGGAFHHLWLAARQLQVCGGCGRRVELGVVSTSPN